MAEQPGGRSLKWLRERGYMATVVEYWQPSFAVRGVTASAQEYAVTGDDSKLLESLNQMKRVGPGKRKDLFGFIDVVAIGHGHILGVQCTAYSGISARVNKIKLECGEAAMAWLENGGKIEVHGWKKFSKPLKRKLWRPVRKSLTIANGSINSVTIPEGDGEDKSKPRQLTIEEAFGKP